MYILFIIEFIYIYLNAHLSMTEMNISQFGKEEKKTRIGYKDRQKKDAFYQVRENI